VNLRHGLLRLALGLAALWFVFWTCAYVLETEPSEMSDSLPPAITHLTVTAVIVATLLLLPWVVLGFRSR
jgi:hypothetical protein